MPVISRRRAIEAPLFLAAVVAVAAPASSARANMAAPITDPGRVGPMLSTKTPLIVSEEKLSFQCEEVGSIPVCSFEARYRIENPTQEASGGRAAFYGLHAEGIVVKVDGRPSSAPLSPEEATALDAEVKDAERVSLESIPSWQEPKAPLVRHGFDVSVPAGGRAEIVVTGRMKPGKTISSRGYVYSPAEGRHLLLHAGDIEERLFELEYLVSPIKTWAAVHRMDVSVRYPSSWRVHGYFRGSSVRAEDQWTERLDGDWIVMTSTPQGTARNPSAIGNALELRISLPGAQVEHGGPFVGVGGVIGTSEARGFRMRFGYEIGALKYFVGSLSIDTDFKERAVIAPNVEVALPHITLLPILPSLGFGFGVPVQIVPTATAGIRLMGSAQFWPVGFVTAVDIFPGLESEKGEIQVSLMGRFSL